MKLSKSALKDLIKECIVEVLSEGIPEISSTSQNLIERKQTATKKISSRGHKKEPRRPRVLDKIKFDQAAVATASSLTQDPVMQSIFADTVKTTLQDQYVSEKNKSIVPPNADRASFLAAEADPTQLLEGSSTWASLAFADPVGPGKS